MWLIKEPFLAIRFVAVPAVRIHCTLCSRIHRALCLAFVAPVFGHSSRIPFKNGYVWSIRDLDIPALDDPIEALPRTIAIRRLINTLLADKAANYGFVCWNRRRRTRYA